ncbi:MAG: aminoacyl-tRNA hydrolase [Clostridiales bacterium]|nr:aminoacyl-tRNA hydrolase [Clostridiales bacterium]MBR3842223.1 aminoacyl-tRNA hydrolase [Christensenellaceae bacterium]
MYMIVGLGNPGRQYEKTKHNAGYRACDIAAKEMGVRFMKRRFDAVLAETSVGGEKVILMKPETYMNNSGQAIRQAMSYYKIPSEKIIVLYDDVDLQPGKLRIREKGSSGTHNGMRSILREIKTENFPRVRIGIGKQPPKMDLADYVMAKFDSETEKSFAEACKNAGLAALEIVKNGVASAQAKYNGNAI